jgi:hypothetical protein
MREPIDMQDKKQRSIDDCGLLNQVLFLALATGIAFDFTLSLELKCLIVSKTVYISMLHSLFFPFLAARLAYESPFILNFE